MQKPTFRILTENLPLSVQGGGPEPGIEDAQVARLQCLVRRLRPSRQSFASRRSCHGRSCARLPPGRAPWVRAMLGPGAPPRMEEKQGRDQEASEREDPDSLHRPSPAADFVGHVDLLHPVLPRHRARFAWALIRVPGQGLRSRGFVLLRNHDHRPGIRADRREVVHGDNIEGGSSAWQPPASGTPWTSGRASGRRRILRPFSLQDLLPASLAVLRQCRFPTNPVSREAASCGASASVLAPPSS